MDARLEKICEKTGTAKSGIEFLVNKYYVKTLGWSEEKAIQHTLELFENGTIDEIKIIGGEAE